MRKRRVVVTGAAGRIAGLLLDDFRNRYDLVLLDAKKENREGKIASDIRISDLTQQDRDTYRHFFRGADTVVHCGYLRWTRDNASEERYRVEMINISMAYNIYQTALEENVRRVVVASSNHAADYFEPLCLDGRYGTVDPKDRAVSDNFYGWAKEAMEHLGFVFAAGRVGDRPLENVQIRIGAPHEINPEQYEKGDHRRAKRTLAAYCSRRDLVQIFVKSIEAEDIRDENGVPFQIFYGVSANARAFWSVVNARRIVGYEPLDDSEVRFRAFSAEHLTES